LSHPVTVLVAVALTCCSNERLTDIGELVVAVLVAAAILGALGSRLHAAISPAVTASNAVIRFMRSSVGREKERTPLNEPYHIHQRPEETAIGVPCIYEMPRASSARTSVASQQQASHLL
jgi:hypothetical protein